MYILSSVFLQPGQGSDETELILSKFKSKVRMRYESRVMFHKYEFRVMFHKVKSLIMSIKDMLSLCVHKDVVSDSMLIS